MSKVNVTKDRQIVRADAPGVIHCSECGRVWGIELSKDEPDAVTKHRAVRALVEEYVQRKFDEERRRVTLSELWDLDLTKIARLTQIVWITEAHAAFCAEKGYEGVLGGCWQDVRYIDLPPWLLKDRKTRYAMVTECRCW